MFGSKKTQPQQTPKVQQQPLQPVPPPQAVRRPIPQKKGADNSVTILTSGCHFNGRLYCRGSSRIGGRIEGTIVSEGLLIIEEGASIVGEIKADEAVIQGHVKGKVEAKSRIELHSTARFEGDILTPVLIISEGAIFNGRSAMGNTASFEKNRTPQVVGPVKMAVNEREPFAAPSDEEIAHKMPEVNVHS